MFLHGKKRLGKKLEKGDIMTRFWYTLKNLHRNWASFDQKAFGAWGPWFGTTLAKC